MDNSLKIIVNPLSLPYTRFIYMDSNQMCDVTSLFSTTDRDTKLKIGH